VKKTDEVEKLIQGIVYGDTVLLADGCQQALILNTKGFTLRSIEEPESERVIRGPREGFNESILTNLSMLRRKIRTQDLKFKFLTFGKRTKTKACICYLDSVVNRSVLMELERRLEKINIDGMLDTNYITEIIKDASYSAVKTVGSTERPDIVAAKLLEGRVALFLDGTPVVLTVPHLFIEHFQADEDYYLNYVFGSVDRILRITAFVLSLCAPAFYVAMVTFHQEMLPTPLLMSVFTSRQGVPFPTALEVILMLVVFEMLRESGARMPGIMGQTLSIVGALVIGQAAVDAKIVSAPVVIVVALAAICGLMVTRLKGYIIIHRFFLLACACVLGLYGLLLGLLVMLTGLFSMTSFEIPIMSGVYAKSAQNYKDIYIRAPWWTMLKRPKFLSENKVRQSGGGEKPR
jgi:spore germination protein KA